MACSLWSWPMEVERNRAEERAPISRPLSTQEYQGQERGLTDSTPSSTSPQNTSTPEATPKSPHSIVDVAPPPVSASRTSNQNLTVSEKLQDLLASAKKPAEPARTARPLEDASYLIPENEDGLCLGFSSSWRGKIIHDSFEAIMALIRNQIASIQKVAITAENTKKRLEEIDKKYSDTPFHSLSPRERKLLEETIIKATATIKNVQPLTTKLKALTTPSAYALQLTQVATENIAKVAAMVKTVREKSNDLSDLQAIKKLQLPALLAHAVTATACHAAEEALTAATVDAMTLPCDQFLEDRVAAAANLVIGLRILKNGTRDASASIKWHTSNLYKGKIELYRRTAETYENFIHGAQMAHEKSASVLAAAEKLHQATLDFENSSRVTQFQNTSTSTRKRYQFFYQNGSYSHVKMTDKEYQLIKRKEATINYIENALNETSDFSYYEHNSDQNRKLRRWAQASQVEARLSNQQLLIETLPSLSDTSEARQQAKTLPSSDRNDHPLPSTDTSYGPAQYYADVASDITKETTANIYELLSTQNDTPIRNGQLMMERSLLLAALDVALPALKESQAEQEPYNFKDRVTWQTGAPKRLCRHLKESLGTVAASSPDIEKIEQAAEIIGSSCPNKDLEKIPQCTNLPKLQYRDAESDSDADSDAEDIEYDTITELLAWKKITDKTGTEKISRAAQEALPAIVRQGNHIAQEISRLSLNDRDHCSELFRQLHLAGNITEIFLAAIDRDSMSPQHQIVFDAAARGAHHAAQASLASCKTAIFISSPNGRQEVINLLEKLCDTHAAAEEAMNAYADYRTRYDAAMKLGAKIRMTISSHDDSLPAQALHVFLLSMNPGIATPPNSTMTIINEAASRSEAALIGIEEIKNRIKRLVISRAF